MSDNIDTLRDFILNNLYRFWYYEGGMDNIEDRIPDYELNPRDYLEFTENELTKNDTNGLINSVSNLKRAVDCQLDIFLSVFGLDPLFRKRNLKFDKKLDFIKAAGIFSPRSLSRLNSIRNKMEHSYEMPKIQDIEMYFDLTLAFISVIESTIVLLSLSEMVLGATENSEGSQVENWPFDCKEYFSISYNFEEPNISLTWDNNGKATTWSAKPEVNIDEFAYYFRIFVLISQRKAFASEKNILSRV